MKKLLMVIPLVILLCFTFSCQQGEEVAEEPAVDVEADIEAIKDLCGEWTVAAKTGDVDRLMSLYADNAVRIPPNEPALIGKEAIRDYFQQFIAEEEGGIVDVKVGGDLAFVHGTWTYTQTPGNGNWVAIYQKQPDGSWKTICEIWSDETLVSPPLKKE